VGDGRVAGRTSSAMTDADDSTLTMHREHLQARHDHHGWLDDIRTWRTEHSALVLRLQAAVQAHDKHLESLEGLVQGHEEALEKHEEVLAEAAREEKTPVVHATHEAAQERHGRVATRIDELRHRHLEVTAKLYGAIKEIEKLAYERKRVDAK
jgi:hypothetical protein